MRVTGFQLLLGLVVLPSLIQSDAISNTTIGTGGTDARLWFLALNGEEIIDRHHKAQLLEDLEENARICCVGVFKRGNNECYWLQKAFWIWTEKTDFIEIQKEIRNKFRPEWPEPDSATANPRSKKICGHPDAVYPDDDDTAYPLYADIWGTSFHTEKQLLPLMKEQADWANEDKKNIHFYLHSTNSPCANCQKAIFDFYNNKDYRTFQLDVGFSYWWVPSNSGMREGDTRLNFCDSLTRVKRVRNRPDLDGILSFWKIKVFEGETKPNPKPPPATVRFVDDREYNPDLPENNPNNLQTPLC